MLRDAGDINPCTDDNREGLHIPCDIAHTVSGTHALRERQGALLTFWVKISPSERDWR